MRNTFYSMGESVVALSARKPGAILLGPSTRKPEYLVGAQAIADRYFEGFIDREDAIARSSNPGKMSKLLAHKRRSDNIVERGEVVRPPEGNRAEVISSR